MKRLIVGVVGLAATVIATSAFGEVIEWKVSDGGNGHFYEMGRASDHTWTTNNDTVNTMQYLGSQGHLLTITSSEENAFIYDNFGSGIGGGLIWLGLTDVASEGTFEWVTGEAFSYNNWRSGEPNNRGNEDYASFAGVDATWNDLKDNSGYGHYFVAEYDGPFTAIPEPPTFITRRGLLGRKKKCVGWSRRRWPRRSCRCVRGSRR